MAPLLAVLSESLVLLSMSRVIRLFIVALCLAVGPTLSSLHAQTITELSREDGRAVFEMNAEWSAPLQAVLDSAGSDVFDLGAASRVAHGVVNESHMLELEVARLPSVRVVASDYEEVRLPLGDVPEEVLDAFTAPVAEATALGTMRRRTVAMLVLATVRYDPEREVLRRYRRVTVTVDLPRERVGGRAARLSAATADNPHLDVSRSVLADGLVLKFPVTEEGVYRITRSVLDDMLADTDVSVDDVDPAELQLFGNGGAPLPALNSAPRPADLVENAVWMRGGSDGSFDDGDALVFYATGPHGWRYEVGDDGSGKWKHYVHPFSNANYYFLRVGTAAGERLDEPDFPGLSGLTPISEVLGRHFVEFDDFNWGFEGAGSGTTWMSNQIVPAGRLTVLDDVLLPGLASGTVTYEARGAADSQPRTVLNFEANGQVVGSLSPGPVNHGGQSPSSARLDQQTFTQPVQAGTSITMTMTVEQRAGTPTATLDWLRVFYPQRLRAVDNMVRFATPGGTTGAMEFVLRGFQTEPQVWDVTDPGLIRRLAVQPAGDTYRVQIEVDDASTPRELIAFTDAGVTALEDVDVEQVPAQNLHGIGAYPEFVIVAPEPFRELAEEHAQRRRDEGMEVLVADRDAIYNEFSGGLPDMRAIRDFFKFLYDRGPGTSDPALRYVLLFGDGHYDFRGIGGESGQTLENWIYPYETENSVDPERSYTSDDYFGLLDDEEGVWSFPGTRGYSDEHLDIGIGRFPVQTVEEGRAVLDKIQRYEDSDTYGEWRSRYLFVADDGFNGFSGTQESIPYMHVLNAEAAGEMVQWSAPEINLRKVYGPTYHDQRIYRNGHRIPPMQEDIMNTLNDGVLVFNYSGHGNPDALAQERLFTSSHATSLRNRDRLPIFITATCSFGRWDMATRQSGAEEVVLNESGGAIAAFTTVRLVFTSSTGTTLNAGLNRELNRHLFEREDDGSPRRLGEALLLTKQTSVGMQGNNLKFNLLGDPTMRIGLPRMQAVVTEVNGASTDSVESSRLRALDRAQFAGEVRRTDGSVASDYDGRATITVYDVERTVQMPEEPYGGRSFQAREDVIWRGDVGVQGGRFTAEFIVPKDISYQDAPGRISIYAQRPGMDAVGHSENIIVGGTADDPPDDNQGPNLRLFLNDTTFVSGGLTPANPDLIVRLYDESGINAVGAGVGHELLLVVDGDDQHAVDLGDRYTSEENSYQRGRVEYSLEDYPQPIETGPHHLRVRAWDVVNNSSEAELEFFVSGSEALELRNVYNYPNPTPGSTYFIFEHNQPPGTPAEVEVRIYTLTGRVVRTFEGFEALPTGVLEAGPTRVPGDGQPWDGLDQDGDPLAPGVYLYKVRVETESPDGDRQVSERIERLAIIR